MGQGIDLKTVDKDHEAKRLGDALARQVEDAGFGSVETGAAGMGGLIFVKGLK